MVNTLNTIEYNEMLVLIFRYLGGEKAVFKCIQTVFKLNTKFGRRKAVEYKMNTKKRAFEYKVTIHKYKEMRNLVFCIQMYSKNSEKVSGAGAGARALTRTRKE